VALKARPAEFDWRSRLSIGAQVFLAAVLALAATLLVTWLAERPALRWRKDLTAAQENTLDPATQRVLLEMPGEVQVDLFFSAPEPPFHVVGREVQGRTARLLRLAVDQSGGRLTVEDHDLSDRTKLSARTQSRRQELGIMAIEPGGLVVVSSGGRRQILRLRGDLADLDPGNVDQRQGPVTPARVASFRGEEALLGAILKVSEDRQPVVVFTAGHGEIDLDAPGERGGLALKRELATQGFAIASWDGSRGDSLPPCDVVVVLGAAQRFTEGEFSELARFVEGGGRALVALAASGVGGEHGAESLLARFGIQVRERGIVCAPVPSVTGGLQTGIPECAVAVVGIDGMPAKNPITDSLRTAGRRVYLWFSRALDRSPAPPAARVLELLRSAPESWLELPVAAGEESYDFEPDSASERGRFTLAMQSAFPPLRDVAPRASAHEAARPEARVLALGSVDALANQLFANNRDFAVNAFDWLASREYRVRVDSRDREARRLDLSRPEPIGRVHSVAVLLLPGLCLLAGFVTWWRRRRV